MRTVLRVGSIEDGRKDDARGGEEMETAEGLRIPQETRR
jgi:hypothetical protein